MTTATDTVGMTREQLAEFADREAQELVGTSFEEAIRRIEEGEFPGSLAADELLSLKRLLDDLPTAA